MATITLEVPDEVAMKLRSLPDEARSHLSAEVSNVITEISQAAKVPPAKTPTLADRLRGRVGRINGGLHPDGRAWSAVEESA